MTLTDLTSNIKQRYIIVILACIILLCVSVVVIMSLQAQPIKSTLLKVISTKPDDEQKEVTLFPEMYVSFSRDLTQEEQKTVKINSSPAISGTPAWISPNKFSYKVSAPLKQKTVYTTSVSFPSGSYSWTFTTIATEKVPLDDQIRIQTQADKEYADHMKARSEKYPWNEKLPIQTSAYYIYFDTKIKVFRGYVFSSNVSSVEQTKVDATTQLRMQGFPVDTYSIVWKIM